MPGRAAGGAMPRRLAGRSENACTPPGEPTSKLTERRGSPFSMSDRLRAQTRAVTKVWGTVELKTLADM